MKFKDTKHEEYYTQFINKAKVRQGDTERKSLFYILALFSETRNHINDLYNFEEDVIKRQGLNEPWQTGGTTKATKLAFNLYNDWRGEDREKENYTPIELFSVDNDYRKYMLYAVELRFEY